MASHGRQQCHWRTWVRAGSGAARSEYGAWTRGLGQHLVDTEAIQVDDLKAPPVNLDCLADLRQVLHRLEHKTCDGLIAALGRELEPQEIGHLICMHRAREQPGSIVAPHRGFLVPGL